MWSPKCLPVVSQMFPDVVSKVFPGIVFHNSQLSSRIVFQVSPSVFHPSPSCFMLFPCCLSAVVFHLSRLSCKCGLLIVVHLSPTTPNCLPDVDPNSFPIASTCFQVASQMWFKCLRIVYLCVELESRVNFFSPFLAQWWLLPEAVLPLVPPYMPWLGTRHPWLCCRTAVQRTIRLMTSNHFVGFQRPNTSPFESA